MANYSALILVCLLIILPIQVFGSHCVMYGFCGENDFGKATCSYNGTAKALDDEHALGILREICPDVLQESNLLCCSAEQVKQLDRDLGYVAKLGPGRCPSCLSNFRKNFCHFTCSYRQSDFLKVESLGLSDEDDIVIERISYFMSRRYAEGMFSSCKDIHGFTPGSTLMDLICGGWGRDCNAEHWLNFMGSTPDNNGYSPFQIDYHLTNDNLVVVNGEKFIPMNENTTLCSESPYPSQEACTCLDCEAACKLNVTAPPPLPADPGPWMLNLMAYLVCFLVFCFVTAFLLKDFVFSKVQSRKSLRCDTEVKMERKGSSHRPLILLKSCSLSASGVDLGSLEEVEPLRSKRSTI